MKFTKEKKKKIRKIRFKKIKKASANWIDWDFEARDPYSQGEEDYKTYRFCDRIIIDCSVYFLVRDNLDYEKEETNYFICRVVREYPDSCVILKPGGKTILKNIDKFSNPENWEEHSIIEFTEQGHIKSVKKILNFRFTHH